MQNVKNQEFENQSTTFNSLLSNLKTLNDFKTISAQLDTLPCQNIDENYLDYILVEITSFLFKNNDLDLMLIKFLTKDELLSSKSNAIVKSKLIKISCYEMNHLLFIQNFFIGHLNILSLEEYKSILERLFNTPLKDRLIEIHKIKAICTLIYADFKYKSYFNNAIIETYCKDLLDLFNTTLQIGQTFSDVSLSVETARALLQLTMHHLHSPRPENVHLFDLHASQVIRNIWDLIKAVRRTSHSVTITPTVSSSSLSCSSENDEPNERPKSLSKDKLKRVILCTMLVKKYQACCRVNSRVNNYRIFMPMPKYIGQTNSVQELLSMSHEKMIRSQDLITQIHLEKDMKFRESLYKLFLEITSGIEPLFAQCEDTSCNNNSRTKSDRPYISFSQRLGDELRLLNSRVCHLLANEKKISLFFLALKALNHVITLTPYQRLHSGLITQLILPTLEELYMNWVKNQYNTEAFLRSKKTSRFHLKTANDIRQSFLHSWMLILRKSSRNLPIPELLMYMRQDKLHTDWVIQECRMLTNNTQRVEFDSDEFDRINIIINTSVVNGLIKAFLPYYAEVIERHFADIWSDILYRLNHCQEGEILRLTIDLAKILLEHFDCDQNWITIITAFKSLLDKPFALSTDGNFMIRLYHCLRAIPVDRSREILDTTMSLLSEQLVKLQNNKTECHVILMNNILGTFEELMKRIQSPKLSVEFINTSIGFLVENMNPTTLECPEMVNLLQVLRTALDRVNGKSLKNFDVVMKFIEQLLQRNFDVDSKKFEICLQASISLIEVVLVYYSHINSLDKKKPLELYQRLVNQFIHGPEEFIGLSKNLQLAYLRLFRQYLNFHPRTNVSHDEFIQKIVHENQLIGQYVLWNLITEAKMNFNHNRMRQHLIKVIGESPEEEKAMPNNQLTAQHHIYLKLVSIITYFICPGSEVANSEIDMMIQIILRNVIYLRDDAHFATSSYEKQFNFYQLYHKMYKKLDILKSSNQFKRIIDKLDVSYIDNYGIGELNLDANQNLNENLWEKTIIDLIE